MSAMNPALSRIVASVPERTTRSLSGTVFSVDGARACSDPARLVSVARLLQWLSPLNPLSGEEQRMLGLGASALRPAFGEEVAAESEESDEARDVTPEERLPL